MKLGYVIIYVPDVLRAVEFYEAAFGLSRKFLHEGGDYAELATGETALAFASESLRDLNQVRALDNRIAFKPPGVEIALVTTDVEQAYAQAVSAGALAYKKPEQKPWGQTVGYVRDLNGVLVELCSPMN
jgi:lactoylglutathione lyase